MLMVSFPVVLACILEPWEQAHALYAHINSLNIIALKILAPEITGLKYNIH